MLNKIIKYLENENDSASPVEIALACNLKVEDVERELENQWLNGNYFAKTFGGEYYYVESSVEKLYRRLAQEVKLLDKYHIEFEKTERGEIKLRDLLFNPSNKKWTLIGDEAGDIFENSSDNLLRAKRIRAELFNKYRYAFKTINHMITWDIEIPRWFLYENFHVKYGDLLIEHEFGKIKFDRHAYTIINREGAKYTYSYKTQKESVDVGSVRKYKENFRNIEALSDLKTKKVYEELSHIIRSQYIVESNNKDYVKTNMFEIRYGDNFYSVKSQYDVEYIKLSNGTEIVKYKGEILPNAYPRQIIANDLIISQKDYYFYRGDK